MAGIYSQTLLLTGGGGNVSYSPATGELAVVKSFVAVNLGSAEETAQLLRYPGPIYIARLNIPAEGAAPPLQPTIVLDLHLAIDDTMAIVIQTGADVHAHAAGFLFIV